MPTTPRLLMHSWPKPTWRAAPSLAVSQAEKGFATHLLRYESDLMVEHYGVVEMLPIMNTISAP